MRGYKKYILTMAMVWTVSLLLFVLVYLLVIGPRRSVKVQLVAESAQMQQKYERAVDYAKEESRKKLLEEVEALKSRLNDYIVEFEDSANLTFDIGRIAANKQVGSFTVKTADQTGGFDKLDSQNIQENRIQIAFESNFRQFASFLNALERHRPVVFVDRFKVTREFQNDKGHKVDMDLSIFVRKRSEG